MEIKILVAYHKTATIIENEIFLPIQVGKATSNNDLQMQGDDQGENISHKNNIYCELTALYWAWKNLRADYIGLCHYRRFFSFYYGNLWKRMEFKLHDKIYKLKGSWKKPYTFGPFFYQRNISNKDQLLNECGTFTNKLVNMLNSNPIDILTTFPVRYVAGNIQTGFQIVGLENLKTLESIVENNFSEYLPYLKTCLQGNRLYYANMSIMKKEVFDTYASYIFSVLAEHEKQTISSGWCKDLNEGCYSRVLGYLGELLTDSFIRKAIAENKKVKSLPVIFYKGI